MGFQREATIYCNDMIEKEVNGKMMLVQEEHTGIQKVRKVDEILKIASVPWYRAGSGGEIAEALLAWEKMKSLYIQFHETMSQAIDIDVDFEGQKTERDQEILKYQLNLLAEVVVLPCAFGLIGGSFKNEDVATSYATVTHESGGGGLEMKLVPPTAEQLKELQQPQDRQLPPSGSKKSKASISVPESTEDDVS